MSSRLQIFVLGHTDAMVASVPRAEHLVPIDLRALTLPDAFNTNLLAESRFLLSEQARRVDAEYVGLCSANFPIRFPNHAPLEQLRMLRFCLRPERVFAARPRRDWRRTTEESHPGMMGVLGEVEDAMRLKSDGTGPFSNTFICHRSHFRDLLKFWDEAFTFVYERYGFDIPFRYRCASCGQENDQGFGRFSRDRHVGFFAERLTMLFFGTQRDLSFWTMPPAMVGSRRSRALHAAGWFVKERWVRSER